MVKLKEIYISSNKKKTSSTLLWLLLMSCSKILFIYDPGSQSEPDHLPPPLLSLMPSMNL